MAKLWRRASQSDETGEPDVVVDALGDDLNTVDAIRAMSTLAGNVLRQALALLGLPPDAPLGDIDVAAIEATIQRRLSLIREKNWAEADRIRDELIADGVQLKDGKDPETGERTTTWEVKR